MTFNRDVTLWSMLPHTHVRGKRWSYEATYPDGRKEALLSVPQYDFEWQTDYIFKHPVKLPKGTTLHATAWYDNSPNNKSNPDATKDVWWGDQTWEEMMFTGLLYSVDPAPPPAAGSSAGLSAPRQGGPERAAPRTIAIAAAPSRPSCSAVATSAASQPASASRVRSSAPRTPPPTASVRCGTAARTSSTRRQIQPRSRADTRQIDHDHRTDSRVGRTCGQRAQARRAAR